MIAKDVQWGFCLIERGIETSEGIEKKHLDLYKEIYGLKTLKIRSQKLAKT